MVVLQFMGLVAIVVVLVVWVHSLVNWDGKCHNDCSYCPYDDGECKLKEERENGQRKPPGTL